MTQSSSGGGAGLRRCSKLAARLSGALVVLGISAWIVRESPARAGNGIAEGARETHPAALDDRARFVAEIERRLKPIHERVAVAGATMLATVGERSHIADSLVNQQITTKRAQANFRNATLTREVAEIGVQEYEEGIFKQDEATLQGELHLAENEAARKQWAVDFTDQRLARIKAVSKGTGADVAIESMYEDFALDAKRRAPTARLDLEHAQFKLKFLREFTRPRKTKQLIAEVEKLRADEWAKKAAWQAEQSKEQVLKVQMGNIAENVEARRVLEGFNRAFGIDGKIRLEMAKVGKNEPLDQTQAKTIRDLVNDLEDVAEQALGQVTALRVDRLKAAMKEVPPSSARSTHDAPTPEAAPAELSKFLTPIRKRLTACQERIAHIGEPLAETIRGAQSPETNAAEQSSKIEAAKAAMKSAILAREGFEMELNGYLTQTFPEEQARYEKQLAQATDDHEQAKKMQIQADERFEKLKKLFDNSAMGIDLELRFEANRVAADLAEKKARFSIEHAQSKLKVLRDFDKDKRTKELKAEISRAESVELAAKAELTLAQNPRGRARSASKNPSAGRKKLLELLEQALACDETVRTKLEALRKNGKTDAGLEKEISDSTNRMEELIERAEAEQALGQFDAVKDAIASGPRLQPRY